MARQFVATSSQYLEVDTPVITAYPLSVSLWFFKDDTTTDRYAFFVGDKDATNEYQAIRLDADEFVSALSRNATTHVAARVSAFTGSTWNQVGGVWSASNSRIAYLNGSSSSDVTDVVINNAYDRTSIARVGDSTPSGYMNGALAEIGVWDVALTAAEMTMLAAGFSPLFIRPGNLVMYVPLIRDADKDVVGGLSFTPVNTPTIVNHPRIIYPSPAQIRRFTTAAAAAGGNTDWPKFQRRGFRNWEFS